MLARRHAFDIFEWDALCCEQRRSFFPIPVFSSEVNIYSAEMHSHMNVDLCKIFYEFLLNIVYVMPGLVFDCKVELGMLWHVASRAVHRAS